MNCRPAEHCPRCGGKDWDIPKKTFDDYMRDLALGCWFSGIGSVVALVVLLGIAWLVIAVVKWMWFNS
jgi:hypothetical protein